MPDCRDVMWLHIDDIPPVTTSHGVGEKRVLATGEDVGSDVTQIARTLLRSGDKVDEHIHPTMLEHFFILSGKCIITIDNRCYSCTRGDYIFIPAGCCHEIDVIEETTMITIGIKTE